MTKNERFVCDTCKLCWTNPPNEEMKCPLCGHILRAKVKIREVSKEYASAEKPEVQK